MGWVQLFCKKKIITFCTDNTFQHLLGVLHYDNWRILFGEECTSKLILYWGGLILHDTKFHVVSNIGWLFYDSLYLGVSRQIFTPASRFG